VQGGGPAAGAIAGDYVSLKNCHRFYAIVSGTKGDGTAITLTPQRATDVAGTNVGALGATVQIWSNADTATTDTLVRQANALNFATAADANPLMVVFQIDPASLGETGGGVPYDVVRVNKTTAGHANDRFSIVYLLDMRYEQATPPSAIVD